MNVRVCCDGEEEVGGHSIVDFLAADERGADAAVIFDVDMIRRGLPAFTLSTRGLCYFHLTLRAGERDLHSGLFGGAALNAAHALATTIDGVVAHDGRLAEPLRKGIVPPTEAELAGWSELPGGLQELASHGAQPADPRAAEEFYLRTVVEPALDVNGIDCGSPYLQKTVLPVVANANLSIRIAPGQDVDEIAAELVRLLHEATPDGATLEVERLSSSPPGPSGPTRKRSSSASRPSSAPWSTARADSLRRHTADRACADREGHLHYHHRLRPSRLEHPLTERAASAEHVPLGIAASRELLLAFAAL